MEVRSCNLRLTRSFRSSSESQERTLLDDPINTLKKLRVTVFRNSITSLEAHIANLSVFATQFYFIFLFIFILFFVTTVFLGDEFYDRATVRAVRRSRSFASVSERQRSSGGAFNPFGYRFSLPLRPRYQEVGLILHWQCRLTNDMLRNTCFR